MTAATRAKISASNQGRHLGTLSPLFGKPVSEETKRKMSAAKKGKYCEENNHLFGTTLSEERKAYLSFINSGEKHPKYGTHQSEASKDKMRVVW